MLKVGLTGGLACGKTFVSRELERLGCHVIHADELGHEVLSPEGEAYLPVLGLFGPEIRDEDGSIDRRQLASLAFNNAEKLAALNAIVHPAVRRRENEIVAAIVRGDPDAIVIVEAAILIETGIYKEFDRLIVVVCDAPRQLERAIARDPDVEEADIRARLGRQLPVNEKRKFADMVIDTSGAKEETLLQTRKIFNTLRQLARHAPE